MPEEPKDPDEDRSLSPEIEPADADILDEDDSTDPEEIE